MLCAFVVVKYKLKPHTEHIKLQVMNTALNDFNTGCKM